MKKPPLPFVGNKFRWWRVLTPLIRALPRHAVCFDAFGGAFSVSRMIKDLRPDCVCICNDYARYFRARLESVEDTNAHLRAMRAAGAYLDSVAYKRYDAETSEKLEEIARDAKDYHTVYVNALQGASGTIRAKCPGGDYDEDLCENYCSDCIIIDELLDAGKAKGYAQACDLVILDPPYRSGARSWLDGKDYIGQTDAAQAFCRAVMECGGSWWLWEKPGAPLMELASASSARVIAYDGKQAAQRAHEVMAVHDGQKPGCGSFCGAAQNDSGQMCFDF